MLAGRLEPSHDYMAAEHALQHSLNGDWSGYINPIRAYCVILLLPPGQWDR